MKMDKRTTTIYKTL